MLGAAAIRRELNRCAELDGGDGYAFGIYEGRRRVELGDVSCAPHRIDGGKGRVHPDGIHDPLLLANTQEPLALQAQGNSLGSSLRELGAVVGELLQVEDSTRCISQDDVGIDLLCSSEDHRHIAIVHADDSHQRHSDDSDGDGRECRHVVHCMQAGAAEEVAEGYAEAEHGREAGGGDRYLSFSPRRLSMRSR